MSLLKSGFNLSNRSEQFFDKLFSWSKPKRKLTVEYKAGTFREYDYNKSKKEKQEEINRILDKISVKGYDALTIEEKELLFRMSGKK
jgi:hypothetical protein